MALNKCDALDDETVAAQVELVAAAGVEDVPTVARVAEAACNTVRRLNAVIAETRGGGTHQMGACHGICGLGR